MRNSFQDFLDRMKGEEGQRRERKKQKKKKIIYIYIYIKLHISNACLLSVMKFYSSQYGCLTRLLKVNVFNFERYISH